MNNVVLSGRLTKDPEVRYTQNGMAVARFTVATDRPQKDAGADFVPCKAFGKTAELMEKFWQKGKPIALSGRIQTGSYETKDGNKVFTVEVVTDHVEFVPKDNTDGQGAPVKVTNKETGKQENIGEFLDTDIPF